MRTNEQGEQVFDPDRKQGSRYQGQARDAHPFDRQSGAGRGTRKPADKKGGAGRGGWGTKADRAHKQGQQVEGVPQGEVPDKIAAAKKQESEAKKVEELG